MTTNNNNATSVIDDLEAEDTSFEKRYSQTLSEIQAVKDWFSTIQCEVSNARSTEIDECNWESEQLTTSFYIKITTTKKAISDKRFEELLSVPPTGWSLFGLNKSRKDGEIVAQYMKDSDYPITAKELVCANLLDIAKYYLENNVEKGLVGAQTNLDLIKGEIAKGIFTNAKSLTTTTNKINEFEKMKDCIGKEIAILESGEIHRFGNANLFNDRFTGSDKSSYYGHRLEIADLTTQKFCEWYYTEFSKYRTWREGDALPYFTYQANHRLW
jgi:hypothetical protein